MDPELKSYLTHALAFLVGVLTGALGHYYGEWWTELRREGKAERQGRERFTGVQQQMPEFIERLKANLTHPGQEMIREFVILPNRNVIYRTSTSAFGCYESEINDLSAKVGVLANHGYVMEVTAGLESPRYRMTEEFVAFVRAS